MRAQWMERWTPGEVFIESWQPYHDLVSNFTMWKFRNDTINITDSFLKDQVALKDWIYYYTWLGEHGSGDSEVLQRGNEHYQDAKDFRLQAKRELKDLMQKLG